LVNDTFAGLVELSPDIDETILFKRKAMGKLSGIGEIFKLVQQLKQRKFDVVFDFQGLFKSAFFAKMSGAPLVIGPADARECGSWFYSRKVAVPESVTHALDRNNYLVKDYLNNLDMTFNFPELKCYDDCAQAAESLLKRFEVPAERQLVAIAPESRWPSKTWPPEFFAKVMDLVAEECNPIIWLLGTKAEQKSGQNVLEHCRKAHPFNFMGSTNLGTMVELLRRSSALVTNDSGPMHIAAALKTPVFAMFGPTNPELTGPYGEGNQVFKGDAGCGYCRRRECPLPIEKCCKSTLSPEKVAKAVIAELTKSTEKSKEEEGQNEKV
jgi:lipopolysaccharide heptosyltransferase II